MKLTRSTRLAFAAVAVSTLAGTALTLAETTAALAASPAVTVTNGPGVTTDAAGNPQGTPPYQITLHLTGYDASSGITVALCTGHKNNASFPYPSDATGCTSFHSNTNSVTSSTGTATISYTVVSATAAQTGSGFQCDFTDPCTLYVGEQLSDFSQPHVFQDIDYNPPPPMAVAPVSPTPQAMTLQQGQQKSITINYGTANDSGGNPETITPSSAVVTPATNGTVVATSPGVFQYTNTNTSATSDTFVVGGATASCPGGCANPATATGNNVTVNVTLSSVTPIGPVSPSPQALTVSNLASGSITINYGTANDSNGNAETITPSSTVVTNPTHGTVTATSPGVFKYTNTDGTQTADSFVVAGAAATCPSSDICHPSSATGNNVTVDVTILGTPSTVTVSGGSGQSAQTNTAFKTNLAAEVTDSAGHPLQGVTVTFTAPPSGASGTFPGPTATATAVTNSAGVATAPTFTANGTAGSYKVVGSVSGVTSTASFSLTNTNPKCKPPTGLLSGPVSGVPVVGPILGPPLCSLGL